MQSDFLTINNETALVDFCGQVKGSSWLAVDTEFEREKTFFPELCLIQIANADIAAVIDPLVLDNLEPVFDLLYDISITKVFHSARQDLELFFNIKGKVPTPLFDTQLAAPLLGYADQIGYGNLVKHALGVDISKAHTRTDWKRRPLSQSQLQYAVNDVIYLSKIYVQFLDKLANFNRLAWLDEDFLALADSALYEPDPDNVWLKIRNANRLKGNNLSVLQKLAAWREVTARSVNRPKKWLLSDDAIFDVAQLLPADADDLSRMKSLNEGLIKRYGADLLMVIKKAKQQAPIPLQKKDKHRALSAQDEAMVDVLMAIVRLRAHEENLNPAILASRKELESLVRGEASANVLKGWSEHMIGNEVRDFLSGKMSLQVVEEQLSVLSG
jgi:ribonuclease D